ncbi:hypothetical protein EPI10_002666 [Gossypium australe]|uniref:Uncharacterized protein n=1 Tax=Gossypium australe TaxID=47621 RepID=A0A5B6VFE8_9ROSI|nr:hypothetical protein EPI10_002666 [Gossypium australe]
MSSHFKSLSQVYLCGFFVYIHSWVLFKLLIYLEVDSQKWVFTSLSFILLKSVAFVQQFKLLKCW